jgi:hypothetical protein
MKKYIVGYLTENYYLDKSEIGNAGIYAFDDGRRFKVPVNAKKLIEEIVTLFGYSFTRTKWLIHDWTKEQKPDFCLKFYWKSHEIGGNFSMPIVRRVMSSTIGQDLVIRKWIDSGLLDNFNLQKQIIAALYESQARQLLE